MPFWYLLSVSPWPNAPPQAPKDRLRKLLGAAAALASMAAAIWFLRERFYRGNPHLPGQTYEHQTAVISNHLHLKHNLHQLVVADWREGRAHISATLCLLLVLLAREIVNETRHARAALWSLCVFASIVCFGYVNETRHYLLLLAFWFAYAWPPRRHHRS
jgi:hypothetical protein